MSFDKEAILQELRERTPKSGEYWKQSKDLVPGGLMSGARKMEPYPVYVQRSKGAYTWISTATAILIVSCLMAYTCWGTARSRY